MEDKQKIGLFSLIALSIGSMIGTGVFGLPADMAGVASTGGIIIGWVITGIGIIALALVFQFLVQKKPEIEGGIYGYARAGFGDFAGFTIGWGYWLSAIIANVAFYVALFAAIGNFKGMEFLKDFTDPRTWITATILLWVYNFLIVAGIRNAAFVNFVTTICKLLPIVFFIIVMIFVFNIDHFSFDFWGKETMLNEAGKSMSILEQVKGTMLITLWVFVGVEGVAVLSSKAKKMSDVGKATVIGLLSTLAIYVLVSVLSLGAMNHAKLAGVEFPSMAFLLEDAVGAWGATLVNVGVIISLVGALLGWTLIAAEIPFQAGKDKLFPKFCSYENKKGSPVGAVFLTSLISQIIVIIAIVFNSSYNILYLLATAAILIPYLSSAGFASMVAFSKGTEKVKTSSIFVCILALVYSVWILYAAGIKYLMLVMLIYAAGIPFYMYSKMERKQQLFKPRDLGFLVGLLALTVLAIVLIATKTIDINALLG